MTRWNKPLLGGDTMCTRPAAQFGDSQRRTAVQLAAQRTRHRSRAFSPQRDALRVATESGDVSGDPAQRGALIQQTKVAR